MSHSELDILVVDDARFSAAVVNRTLAAAGIPGFRDLMRDAAEKIPLRRHITTDEVASATLFLLTNTGVTGEVLHVDAGYNILG